MIAKTAYLIKSPFDMGYENVPDCQINTTKAKFIENLEEYFSNYSDVFVYKITDYFENGMSVPYNFRQSVNITFNNMIDSNIFSYNYLILTDAQYNDNLTKFPKVQIINRTCEFYFIENIEINNSNANVNVTFSLVKDLWTEYYENFLNAPMQKVLRRHIDLNTEGYNAYTLDNPQLEYKQQRTDSGTIILFLKLLLDNGADLQYSFSDDFVNPSPMRPSVINRGTYRELLIPVQVYFKNGYIDDELTTNGIVLHSDTAGVNDRYINFQNGRIELKSQYIVGAYLTFHPENFTITTINNKRYITFNTDNYREIYILENGEYKGLHGIHRIGGVITSITDTNEFTDASVSYYNISRYNGELASAIKNSQLTIDDIIKVTVERYLDVTMMPCMNINGNEITIKTMGKAKVIDQMAGTQSGIVHAIQIFENDRQLTDGILSNVTITPQSNLPVTVSQYDAYFTNNSNAHNFKVLKSNMSQAQSIVGAITSGVDLSGKVITAIGTKGTSEAASTMAGLQTGMDETNNVVSQAINAYTEMKNEEYLTVGLAEDLKRQVSNISGGSNAPYNGYFNLDRIIYYLKNAVANTSALDYYYNCHICGTAMPDVRFPTINCRERFDYIQIEDYRSTIYNAKERAIYNTIFNRGTRKIHLERLTDNVIKYMYCNEPMLIGG